MSDNSMSWKYGTGELFELWQRSSQAIVPLRILLFTTNGFRIVSTHNPIDFTRDDVIAWCVIKVPEKDKHCRFEEQDRLNDAEWEKHAGKMCSIIPSNNRTAPCKWGKWELHPDVVVLHNPFPFSKRLGAVTLHKGYTNHTQKYYVMRQEKYPEDAWGGATSYLNNRTGKFELVASADMKEYFDDNFLFDSEEDVLDFYYRFYPCLEGNSYKCDQTRPISSNLSGTIPVGSVKYV